MGAISAFDPLRCRFSVVSEAPSDLRKFAGRLARNSRESKPAWPCEGLRVQPERRCCGGNIKAFDAHKNRTVSRSSLRSADARDTHLGKPLDQLFQGLNVITTSGQKMPASELWLHRRVVVAWARHFGCLLCKKRAALLAARKADFDRAGVSLVIIGPGTGDQARVFQEQTSFPGEIYADPTSETFSALGFVSGVGTIFTPQAGLNLIGALGEGFRQDWRQSLQKDTVLKGAWQQGGLLVAGPGHGALHFLHKDKEAGDEPDLDEVLKACQEAQPDSSSSRE